ncbi:MAG: hypothetical protein JOZ14_20540 [Acidobacteria bacterium]|nr:hypothetical protein [Acidobacteriota bacterium]
MYNGTLIEDLIATVERVETSFRMDPQQKAKMVRSYPLAQKELPNLKLVRYDSAEVA